MTNEFLIEVESLDLEGRGIGRRDGKAIFIEGALPGEQVVAISTKIKPSYEVARLVELRRASTLRVTPPCPHFGLERGSCGGCAMQHITPRAQVAIKQRALEDALWHIGRVRPERVLRPIHGPDWRYRFRARLTARNVSKKGGVLVGFHERGSSYVADMRECHVLPQEVSNLLLPLRELIGSLTIASRMPQIELAVAQEKDRLRIALVLRILQSLAEQDHQLLQQFAQRHQVEFWLQPSGPDTVYPLVEGTPDLSLELPEFGVSLPFKPTDFTQVNHAINQVMVSRALRLLAPQPHERVADFFCGLGNFTLPLATRAGSVVGLEGHAGLIKRAQQSAAQHGLEAQTQFVVRNLFDWTADDWQELNRTQPIDAMLIDPPREGAQAVVTALVGAKQRPRRIVYVSCNPATLARDCSVLVHDAGWHLRAAGAVNMFPQTAHVESMAVLEPGTSE